MSRSSVFTRIKWLIVLVMLMMVDILPMPILGLICLYLLLFRPDWFRDGVNEIYESKTDVNSHPDD